MLWTILRLTTGITIDRLMSKTSERPLKDLARLAAFYHTAAKQLPDTLLDENTRWLLAYAASLVANPKANEDHGFVTQFLAISVRSVEDCRASPASVHTIVVRRDTARCVETTRVCARNDGHEV